MGYHTEFEGRLELSPPLNPSQVGVINRFSKTRHGGNTIEFMLSFWCHWVVTPDGKFLRWNGGEKFSAYVAWLHHLNRMFFTRWQVTLSGEIRWREEKEKDVGLITATPVTREDGIRTTEIHPPTELLDDDLDDMEEEIPQGLENAFLVFPGFLSWHSEGTEDAELKKLSESNPVTAPPNAGWKLARDDGVTNYKRYLKWEGAQDDLLGCIEWLRWFVRVINKDEDDDLSQKMLLGSVSFPGGLKITARLVNRDGKCVNDINVLPTPSLPPAMTNSLALFNLGSLIMDIKQVVRFMEMEHGDTETSEPWIVPGSLRCGWRFGFGALVWGGGDDLRGCVHWLRELDLRFFRPYGVLLAGTVKLPNGALVTAEVEKRGSYAVTRITPKLPRYDCVRVGGGVEVREVDTRGWMVKCRVVSCKGNCGWFEEQQEVPLRKDHGRKCPRCEQGVLWTKKVTPPATKRNRVESGDEAAAPASKRR